jgi:uncharacterized protein (DUF1919 family)
MTIDAKSFIRLISHPENYLGKEMVYAGINDYECIIGRIEAETGPVDFGLVHYDTVEDATKAWIKRSNRINYDNLLIKFSDRWTTEDEMLGYCEELSKLPYKNKLVFTRYKSVYRKFKNFEGFKVIYCPEYYWHDSTSEWKYDKYHFNVIRYLNRLKK